MMMIKFNINHKVKVKLTEEGRKILKAEGEVLIKIYPDMKEFAELNYMLPEIDEDGYSTYQLWDLMKTFGDHMYNGCSVPFETEILILTEEEKN